MLEESGFSVHLGGNIGTPLLDKLSTIASGDKVVMELSSFQTELITRSPSIAAVLNITPNHLDRHPSMSHYAAAKAGLEGIVHGLMREFPRRGIRINMVHPCVVDTDLLRERYDTEEKRARLAAQVPLGQLARPEDIGHLVAFLCSDLGGFICGQSLLVDGGRTMWKQ